MARRKSEETKRPVEFRPKTKYTILGEDYVFVGYSQRDKNSLCMFLQSAPVKQDGIVMLDQRGSAAGLIRSSILNEASIVFDTLENGTR